MSGTVLAFKPKSDPHCTGSAKCIACGDTWVAVAPAGTMWLECAKCGTMKGTWVHPTLADVGDMAFTCNCGSEALTAYKRGGLFHLICMNCGVDQTEAIFGG